MDKAVLLRAVVLPALLGLAACDQGPNPPETSFRPAARVAPPPPKAQTQPSLQSRALAEHFQRVQDQLLVQGLLRTDGGGVDTPFTDTILAQNFVRIALYDEYDVDSDLSASNARLSRLLRWETPVRIGVRFGSFVPQEQRENDAAAVQDYAARLSRITGHPIDIVDSDPNFHVLFLNEDDRKGFGPQLLDINPDLSTAQLNALINLPKEQYCVVATFGREDSSEYFSAIAIIRSEHPDLLRLSCIHEELAQGLGLANDHPKARPSIFNDDEEFGLLTTHDELLLRMLYDRRLKAGMTPATAAPIARTIARELLAPTPS